MYEKLMLKMNNKTSHDKTKLVLKMVKLREIDDKLVYGLRGDYE